MTCFKYRLKGQLEVTAKCESPIKTPRALTSNTTTAATAVFKFVHFCIQAFVDGLVLYLKLCQQRKLKKKTEKVYIKKKTNHTSSHEE